MNMTLRTLRLLSGSGTLGIALLLPGCDRPNPPSAGSTAPPSTQGAPAPVAPPAPVTPIETPVPLRPTAPPSTQTSPAPLENSAGKDEIDELIETLAISEKPPAFARVYMPRAKTPPIDKIEIAYEAAAKLRKYGMAAFPQLLANRYDRRESVALRRVILPDVGFACFNIIEDVLYSLPPDYRASFTRLGTDKKTHLRPRFCAPGIFDSDTVEAWLAERHDKSLTELQIEVLTWLIEQEKRIGFPDDQDREMFLLPLERQVTRLRAIPEVTIPEK